MSMTRAPEAEDERCRCRRTAGRPRSACRRPDSQPNASQITNAVEIGTIVAARTRRPEAGRSRTASRREVAGDRAEGPGGVLGRGDRAAQSRGRGRGAATTMKTAMTFVQIAPPIASACSSAELVLADALLGDGALEVELHVRRDRRPDEARPRGGTHRRRQVDATGDERAARRAPVRVGQERRDDVGDEDDHHREEDALDRSGSWRTGSRAQIATADDRHGEPARDAEDLERGR